MSQSIIPRRHDGYWELLATAAGVEESIERTTRALAGTEIRKAAHGLAIAPSLIRERVEALAAWNPHGLATVADGWLSPAEINGDPWWTAAWEASLRHLKALGAVTRSSVTVPELAREVELLWPPSSEGKVAWRATIKRAQSTFVPFDELRRLSVADLEESILSKADVDQVPLRLFRLLRGKASRLDASARSVISSMAVACMDGDPFDAAIVVELQKNLFAGDLGPLRERMTRSMRDIADPRTLAPLFYVLVGDWQVP